MLYTLNIVADQGDLELLREVAADIEEVTVGTPTSLDTSGDGLSFPIDWDVAIEGLKVVAAAVTSINAVRQLLEAWSRRRRETKRPPDDDAQQTTLIADVRTGTVLYSEPSFDESAAATVESGLAKLHRSEDGR